MAQWEDAYEAVDHIQPELDPTVQIDYLIWAIDKKTLNLEVPSDALKQRYLAIADSSESNLDGKISRIRKSSPP